MTDKRELSVSKINNKDSYFVNCFHLCLMEAVNIGVMGIICGAFATISFKIMFLFFSLIVSVLEQCLWGCFFLQVGTCSAFYPGLQCEAIKLSRPETHHHLMKKKSNITTP